MILTGSASRCRRSFLAAFLAAFLSRFSCLRSFFCRFRSAFASWWHVNGDNGNYRGSGRRPSAKQMRMHTATADGHERASATRVNGDGTHSSECSVTRTNTIEDPSATETRHGTSETIPQKRRGLHTSVSSSLSPLARPLAGSSTAADALSRFLSDLPLVRPVVSSVEVLLAVGVPHDRCSTTFTAAQQPNRAEHENTRQ